MRVMAANPHVAVTSRHVLMGNMQVRALGKQREFRPDHRIFSERTLPIFRDAHGAGKRMIVSKEELGNDRHTGDEMMNECNFDIFPNEQSIKTAKPVFTFRKPDDGFDSWLSKGWSDIESFLIA